MSDKMSNKEVYNRLKVEIFFYFILQLIFTGFVAILILIGLGGK